MVSSPKTSSASLVSDDQRAQFATEGYFILERAIPDDHLEVLRSSLDGFVEDADRQMDAAGVDSAGLNHRGKRYFIVNRWQTQASMAEFLFSDLTADICRATLGPDAYLFWEQFVVKAPEVGMTFSWHQDSGYLKKNLGTHSRPYLTCWCALDDMSESNGTIFVLPFSRAGSTDISDHTVDPETNDLVGYFGDDPGDPVVVPAGSIAVFSTLLFHRSGPNTSGRSRRSYVAQYSAEPILDEHGTPVGFVEPFVRDGRRVR